ncbi:LOW QUALITY PROTEIN: uncharacterized protein Dere_GG26432 [Drosophila erecta]|uniref:Seminal fluid protein n=1 Tax=Drosophila erecta TaxID=7220 RepID=A0A0Q5VXG9_DROER|nr:LOW QUALITY PROTEIN: uncharacterized protein Dere_GG26432 [Drosophila erecta]
MKFMAITLLGDIFSVLGITIGQLNEHATNQSKELVKKYKLQAARNPEFSQWIRELGKTSLRRMEDKTKDIAEFNIYDESRQLLEAKIKKRIGAIDGLISNIIGKTPNKDKSCLQYYQRQKQSPKMAHNSSNLTKQTNPISNSEQCETTKGQLNM